MQTPRISTPPDTPENPDPNRAQQITDTLRDDWVGYSAIFFLGVTFVVSIGYFIGNAWPLAGLFIVLLGVGIGSHALSKRLISYSQIVIEDLEERGIGTSHAGSNGSSEYRARLRSTHLLNHGASVALYGTGARRTHYLDARSTDAHRQLSASAGAERVTVGAYRGNIATAGICRARAGYHFW